MTEYSAPVLRCKLKARSVTSSNKQDGKKYGEHVGFEAVYSTDPADENTSWSEATPSAQFTMFISNPGAFGKIVQGEEYYVDITPANRASLVP